ncbi:hypothetical protein BJV77DRAFT_1015883, partial [Russula vinacea]
MRWALRWAGDNLNSPPTSFIFSANRNLPFLCYNPVVTVWNSQPTSRPQSHSRVYSQGSSYSLSACSCSTSCSKDAEPDHTITNTRPRPRRCAAHAQIQSRTSLLLRMRMRRRRRGRRTPLAGLVAQSGTEPAPLCRRRVGIGSWAALGVAVYF